MFNHIGPLANYVSSFAANVLKGLVFPLSYLIIRMYHRNDCSDGKTIKWGSWKDLVLGYAEQEWYLVYSCILAIESSSCIN